MLCGIAEKYVHEGLPVLFVDGCDVLATHHISVMENLIQAVKVFADDHVLTIVFVSSYGSILPILKRNSSCTARAIIFVILAIKTP